jgi:hypothetical protein
VRRRIIGRGHLIGALRDNLAVSHNYRAERAAAPRLNSFNRQLNRPRHESIAQVLSPPVRFLNTPGAFSSSIRESAPEACRKLTPIGKYMPGKPPPSTFFILNYRFCRLEKLPI